MDLADIAAVVDVRIAVLSVTQKCYRGSVMQSFTGQMPTEKKFCLQMTAILWGDSEQSRVLGRTSKQQVLS